MKFYLSTWPVAEQFFFGTRCHAAPCSVGATENVGRQWILPVRQIAAGRPDWRQGLGRQRQPRPNLGSAADQTNSITAVNAGGHTQAGQLVKKVAFVSQLLIRYLLCVGGGGSGRLKPAIITQYQSVMNLLWVVPTNLPAN
jgi:hypothetical protein